MTRNDVVISRNMIFIEEKPINQTSAIYEKLRIIYDSITILSRSSEESMQQLSISSVIEHADSDSDSKEPESKMIDPQILLQEFMMNELQESIDESSTSGSTSGETRTSTRSNKEILISMKFRDENFEKRPK